MGEEVVEEVDEEKKKRTRNQQQHRRTVDRPGRPSAEEEVRSTDVHADMHR